MSTSGVATLPVDGSIVITDALFLIGALEEGESITGEHTAACRRTANLMLKAWQAHGIHMWTQTEGVLFLNPDQQVYTLPTDNCAVGTFGYTTLDGTASGNVIVTHSTVPDNLPALAAGDYVGVELPDGTREWTTQFGSPNADGVTIHLTDSLSVPADDGATVFWYTTNINKPLRILGMRRAAYNANEIPVELVARDIYMEQPSKAARSVPTLAHYSPQRTTGLLYVWPVSSDCRNILKFTHERQLELISAVTDEIDLPMEWSEAFIWNLAWRMGPQYGTTAQAKAQALKPDALAMLDQMLEFDNDSDAIYFQP